MASCSMTPKLDCNSLGSEDKRITLVNTLIYFREIKWIISNWFILTVFKHVWRTFKSARISRSPQKIATLVDIKLIRVQN